MVTKRFKADMSSPVLVNKVFEESDNYQWQSCGQFEWELVLQKEALV